MTQVRYLLFVPVEKESIAKAFFFWLAFSSLVLWLGPFTNYSPAGFIDPWVYTGYFTNFSNLVHQFGLLYYPSRLPYVLFGVSMYAVFSPPVANFLINLCILTAGLISLYCIVARHQGRAIAALTGFAFCFNPYVMSSVSWDYPDGPAIAFLLLGLWVVLAPPPGLQGRRGMFLVGSLWAMAGFTNLIAGLIILPGVILIAYVRPYAIRQLGRDGLFVLMGVLFTTGCLAILSRQIFGDHRFYTQQVKMLLYMSREGRFQQMWGTGLTWLNSAYRLVATYGLTVIGGLFFIRHFGRLKSDRFYIGTYAFLFLCNVLFIFVEFGMKAVVLRVAYTSSYLVVPVFIFLAALIGALRKIALTNSSLTFELLLWLTVVGADAVPVYIFSRPNQLVTVLQHQYWAVAAYVGIAGLLACTLFASSRFFGTALAAASLTFLLSFSTTVDPALSYVFADSRPAYEAAIHTQNLLTSGIAKNRMLRFWFDNDEHWSPLFNSINSLYLWGWRDYSHLMPTMSVDELRYLFSANTTVVHLTQEPGRVEERTKLMAGRNIFVQDDGRWTVSVDNVEFQVIVQDVVDASSLK